MLHNHLADLLIKNLGHNPTEDQCEAISLLGKFLVNDNDNTVFILRGYAGTGKTTLVATLVKTWQSLKQKVVLLAPTGRAAKVLSSYAGMSASTIHKKIYRRQSSVEIDSKFLLDRNLHRNTLFIVDESSMIGDSSDDKNLFGSGNLLLDLLDYVDSGKNCKLIFSGDVAQLPPVGIRLSPALREQELEFYGKKVIATTLRQVVRQSLESGILSNATVLRNRMMERNFSLPFFRTATFKDVSLISGQEFPEIFENCIQRFGLENVAVITRSNQMANIYNRGIRQSILWFEEELTAGERLMVVKNNYFWIDNERDFIANGDIVLLKKVRKQIEKHGFRFAEATIVLPDMDNLELDVLLLLDTLYSNAPALSNDQGRDLYQSIISEYDSVGNKRKRMESLRKDAFFNALQIKYAYALTCHKAQGGQWKAVFIDQGHFSEDMLDMDYLRWLYTAVTRAQEELYFVNFNSQFFNPI